MSYLVLLISDERDEVRFHILNLLCSGRLGCEQILSGVPDAVFTPFSPLGSVSPGWQATSPTTASTGAARPVA
ncbi:hypothetical protein [Edaphobacter aggregans]|uniref:hypothetical protein n=1 Tax=Edaphobacter aggregans TaxID=570835 RepID=UPI000F745756|nr:hypothetical protein [Edaphobacter aggregans]